MHWACTTITERFFKGKILKVRLLKYETDQIDRAFKMLSELLS